MWEAHFAVLQLYMLRMSTCGEHMDVCLHVRVCISRGHVDFEQEDNNKSLVLHDDHKTGSFLSTLPPLSLLFSLCFSL